MAKKFNHRGALFDGLAAVEIYDSTGQILDVKTADITSLVRGDGVANWEHHGPLKPDLPYTPSDIVAKIVYAQKIFSADDCKTKRMRQFYDEVKAPCIYIIARAYDGAGHTEAQNMVAQIRDAVAHDEAITIRWSIEGGTLAQEGDRLLYTIARRVSCTIVPCNKGAISGLLLDPQAPEGYPVEVAEDLEDALSVLTPIPEAQAVIKSEGGFSPLVDRLTEVLDRWADEDLEQLIRDAVPGIANPLVREIVALAKSEDEEGPEPKKDAPITRRGQKLKPPPKSLGDKRLAFDEGKGLLHTPHGTFPLYTPDRDQEHKHAGQAFKDIWHSEKVRRVHDYALDNWMRVHKALKAGTLPQSVLATATMFSNLSPNTPVGVHEMMYGHLVDRIRQGEDPRSPDFGRQENRDAWKASGNTGEMPVASRPYFEDVIKPLITTGEGRKSKFMLADNKFDNMANYHKYHDHFASIVARHGTDGRAIVRDLLAAKAESGAHNERRRREVAAGKPDPGPHPLPISGLAPKTARFTAAMIGAGNAMVHDTHMTRHLFGLDKHLDAPAIRYVRGSKVMWGERPFHDDLRDAVDRWYGRNHMAVQLLKQHPKHGAYFREHPEQAIFPAFWGHWLGISSHERELGHQRANVAYNAEATHRPIWEEIERLMDEDHGARLQTQGVLAGPDPVNPPKQMLVQKSEAPPEDDGSVDPRQAAEWLQQIVDAKGEVAGLLFFFTHLVPMLWPEDHNADPEDDEDEPEDGDVPEGLDLVKFEAAVVGLSRMWALCKAESDTPPVSYGGSQVLPGLARVNREGEWLDYWLLSETPSALIAVPEGLTSWSSTDMIRLHPADRGSLYIVMRHPRPVAAEGVARYQVIHESDPGLCRSMSDDVEAKDSPGDWSPEVVYAAVAKALGISAPGAALCLDRSDGRQVLRVKEIETSKPLLADGRWDDGEQDHDQDVLESPQGLDEAVKLRVLDWVTSTPGRSRYRVQLGITGPVPVLTGHEFSDGNDVSWYRWMPPALDPTPVSESVRMWWQGQAARTAVTAASAAGLPAPMTRVLAQRVLAVTRALSKGVEDARQVALALALEAK